MNNISITLSAYEIVNLLQALGVLPENGNWKTDIINKIQNQLENIGYNTCQLKKEYMSNSGMSIKEMKRHLEILEWKEKYRNNNGNHTL